MIARYAVAYLASGIAFAAIDFCWLSYAGSSLYRPILGEMMLAKPRMGAAVAFYLIYIAGIVVMAVAPAGRWQEAALKGALFGFFCYATYDLTNQATLKMWALKITVLDIVWGTLLTGVAATAGWFAGNAVGK
jgi:uncharacterized membrane protein